MRAPVADEPYENEFVQPLDLRGGRITRIAVMRRAAAHRWRASR